MELKVGAQVILIRTLSASRGLVNGSRGVVQSFVGGALKQPIVRFVNVSNMAGGGGGCIRQNVSGRLLSVGDGARHCSVLIGVACVMYL